MNKTMTGKEEFVTFILNNYDKLNWMLMTENAAEEVYIYTACVPKVCEPKYIIHVGGTRLSTYVSIRNQDSDQPESFEINEVQDNRTSRLFDLVHNKVKNDTIDDFFHKAIAEISKSIE